MLVDAIRRFTVPAKWGLLGVGVLVLVLVFAGVIESWAVVAAWILIVMALLGAFGAWLIEWIVIRIINRVARPRWSGDLDRDAVGDRLRAAGIPTGPFGAVVFAWRLTSDRRGLERRLQRGYERLRTDFPEVFGWGPEPGPGS